MGLGIRTFIGSLGRRDVLSFTPILVRITLAQSWEAINVTVSTNRMKNKQNKLCSTICLTASDDAHVEREKIQSQEINIYMRSIKTRITYACRLGMTVHGQTKYYPSIALLTHMLENRKFFNR